MITHAVQRALQSLYELEKIRKARDKHQKGRREEDGDADDYSGDGLPSHGGKSFSHHLFAEMNGIIRAPNQGCGGDKEETELLTNPLVFPKLVRVNESVNGKMPLCGP